LYFFQEKLIFFPDKLNKNYQFSFNQPFEEVNIKTKDNKRLHGLLFTAERAKGLVFYLHGNAGALNSWGEVAKRYTSLNYDVYIFGLPRFWKKRRNHQ
jgi:alpha-beta hydrolase superfamily lysophospholipase